MTVAGEIVEEQRLLDRRDQAVANAAQHGVVGPDHQQVFAMFAELAAVVHEVILQCHIVAMRQTVGYGRVDLPDALFHLCQGDRCQRLRMFARLVDQEDRVEDLHGRVRVHGRIDLRDGPEIAIDELAQPYVILDGTAPGTAPNEQLEVR